MTENDTNAAPGEQSVPEPVTEHIPQVPPTPYLYPQYGQEQQYAPQVPPPGPAPRQPLTIRVTRTGAVAAALVAVAIAGAGVIGWAIGNAGHTGVQTAADGTSLSQLRQGQSQLGQSQLGGLGGGLSLPGQGGSGQGGTGQGIAGVIGSITAIDGNNWTVSSRSGESVTVTVDSDTSYGQLQQSDFAVGDVIVAEGETDGSSLQAAHVMKRSASAPSSPGVPSSPETEGQPS